MELAPPDSVQIWDYLAASSNLPVMVFFFFPRQQVGDVDVVINRVLSIGRRSEEEKELVRHAASAGMGITRRGPPFTVAKLSSN